VVIIGSSFIGMEAAAALINKAASVHVIGTQIISVIVLVV
jgi:pyruvate/2-oxoglutarate dehydrogenase complex dihydrolipoamide dehydrogenase (E3) component